MTRRTFLRVTKSVGYTDESVTRIEPDHAVSAGIRWGSIADDMVPLFEEHAARIAANYSLAEWMALEPLERAMVIAVRRIENAMHALQTEAEIKDAKRKGAKR